MTLCKSTLFKSTPIQQIRWFAGFLVIMSLMFAVLAPQLLAQNVEGSNPKPRIRPEQGDPSLPWNRVEEGDQPPTAEAADKSKRFLLKVDTSQLANLIDGSPFERQHETLVRVIDGLRRIDLDRLAEWSNSSLTVEQIIAEPEEKKLEVIGLSGTITDIIKLKYSEEIIERFSVPGYYLVTMQLDDSDKNVIICSRSLPEPWKKFGDTPFHAQCYGLFLQTATPGSVSLPEDAGEVAVFATTGFQWFPTEVNPKLGVTADLVRLAKGGVDIGQLLALKQEGKIESGPFYGVMNVVKTDGAAEMSKLAKNPMDLAAVLQDPAKHTGEFVRVKGTARRAEKIFVPDDIQDKLGIDHYYHVDVTVSLDNKKIVIGDNSGARPEFYNEYPVTVCVLEVPEELKEDKLLNRQVEIPAVFFKNWAYSSEFLASFGMNNQPSPVFIAYEPILLEPPKPDTLGLNVFAGVLFLTLLGGVWLAVWLFNRSDKAFERGSLAKQYELAKGENLDKVQVDDNRKPDFSNLE